MSGIEVGGKERVADTWEGIVLLFFLGHKKKKHYTLIFAMNAILALFFFRLSSRQPRRNGFSQDFLQLPRRLQRSWMFSCSILSCCCRLPSNIQPGSYDHTGVLSFTADVLFRLISSVLLVWGRHLWTCIFRLIKSSDKREGRGQFPWTQRSKELLCLRICPKSYRKIKNCVQNQLHSEKSILIMLFFSFAWCWTVPCRRSDPSAFFFKFKAETILLSPLSYAWSW